MILTLSVFVRTLPNADEIFRVRDKMSKRVQETMNEGL